MNKVKVKVPAVKIAKGIVQPVTFVARKRAVTVRTKGMPKIVVRPLSGLGEKGHFEAVSQAKPSKVYMGRTPAKAFARAVRASWQ